MRHRLSLLCLLLAAVLPAAAQQRIEFQRQKFDRSRFERPDPSARPTLPGTPAAPAESAPEPAAPAFPAAPAPMVTQAPAAPATNAPEFSFSAETPAPAATATPAFAAPTGTVIFSADAPPPPAAGAVTPPTPADVPLWDEVPAKWFDNAKDHDELVELSKKTGACLLLYFKNPSVPNEKGLCSWFEKTIMPDLAWRKAMKYFIKLEVTLPGNSATRDLAEKYRIGKTPVLLVVKPSGGLPMRVMVFDVPPNARPQPLEVPVVLESLKARSTPAYMTLF